MRSSGERTTSIYLYIYIYIYIYRDSASVESTRGGSLTLAPIRNAEHFGASVSDAIRPATYVRLRVAPRMRSSGCRPFTYIYRDSASVESTRGGLAHARPNYIGECYALWGERERRAVVSVSNLRCWLSESCCRRSSLSWLSESCCTCVDALKV